MALQLTNNERIKLGLKGLKTAPQKPFLGFTRNFDAIWVGRDDHGVVIIRGWLLVVAFEDDGDVLAMVTQSGEWDPFARLIPEEELVWLFHGPRPPGVQARVSIKDPIMALPGEADAYRLRRILGVPPLAIIPPSELINRQPEFCMDLRIRSPASNLMSLGCKRLKSRVRFVADYHDDGGVRQASAGLSLLWWFLSLSSTKKTVIDWEALPRMEARGLPPFMSLYDGYQALRLPGLRLLVEYRATRLSDAAFIQSMADTHALPVPLVSRRLGMLHQFADDLALF